MGLEDPKGTVDAWVLSFASLATVTVMTLAKGPPTGAIIPRAAKSGCWRQRKWGLAGLRLRQCLGMVIVQVNVHSEPVHHTSSCSILVKCHIVMEPRLPRKLAGSLENQQFVLRHILPPGWECRTKNPSINCEGLHTGHYFCDFLNTLFYRTNQEFPIQIHLWLSLLSFEVFSQKIGQVDKLTRSDLCD